MNFSKDSDLLKMRQMGNNNPNNLREIAARIYDKKLKSFLALETKQQVLMSCQELLINKTVDYMNVITELETGQLKSLNSLNDLLCEKSNTLGNLNSNLGELKEVNKEQSITIAFLNKDVEVLRKEIADVKIKLEVTQERLVKTVQENERKNSHLKSQFYQIKSNLEKEKKQLKKQLNDKVEELKNTNTNFKSDITYLKTHQEREIADIHKRYKQIIARYEIQKQQMFKDKKYLQDLIEVKDDEIREVKLERPRLSSKKWSLENGGKIDILVPPTQIQSPKRQRSRSRVIQKPKKEETKKADKKKEKGKQKDKQRQMDSSQKKERDIGVQTNNQMQTTVIHPPSPQISQCYVQTMVDDPTEDTTDEAEIRLRSYLDEQYKILFSDKVKQMNKKYAKQFKQALNDARTFMFQLSVLTQDQIRLSNTKFLEMEKMYEQRPSREEDLEYITTLILQNKSLMGLCNQANQKTDSAYVALQEYHSKLESYKKLVPMNISGGVPPNIHSTREVISRPGRSQSIKPFNSHNSYNSWMMSQPNTSRRLTRVAKNEEETFDLTQNILITDFEMSDTGSPLKRKHLQMRPQTGNINSLRKKSQLR